MKSGTPYLSLPENRSPSFACADFPVHGLFLLSRNRKSIYGRGIYGYNWWVINKGKDAPVAAAFTSELNHNVCLIVPEGNMDIVRQGTDENPAAGKQKVYSEVIRRLAKGMCSIFISTRTK